MSNWAQLQAKVSKAIKDPEHPTPEGISLLKQDAAPTKRFNVYRNNVALSLANVLSQRFPVVEQLVGEKFFRTMARHYTTTNLPNNPIMIDYGGAFPAFVKTYQPVADLPYLPNIAQLEWAWKEAYYSADKPSIAIDCLANYQEAEIPTLTFELHPSLRVLSSDWPIVSIWQAHQTENPEAHLKDLPETGEAVLICRPHLDVTLREIAPSTLVFIKALQNGSCFAVAVEVAAKTDNNFDIPANLAGLFSIGAVTAVHLD